MPLQQLATCFDLEGHHQAKVLQNIKERQCLSCLAIAELNYWPLRETMTLYSQQEVWFTRWDEMRWIRGR